MSRLHPPIEPYDHGMLGVGDGHELYWETCGNPDGLPALFLHGGPGSGSSAGQRRLFDPGRFRAVLFDQRGSGRSRPLPDGPNPDLSSQTTGALVEDIERLRRHLGVERWTILGMSWGTTLGLAYAQTHPDRVAGMVLALVTTTSRREVDWITEGVGRIFPAAWERFAGAVPERLRHLRLVDAYATMLADPDAERRAHAAREWCRWEDAHVSLTPGHAPNPRFEDPDFRLRFSRLVTHYWRHSAFLEEEQLIRDAAVLDGIPGAMIHGRFDVSSPLETPWMLSKRWETGRLRILDDAGHGGEPLIDAVLEGLDEVSE